MDVRRATTETEREDAFAVRRRVFVDEQDVPADLEWDDHDDAPGTVHFVAYDDGDPVGAARLRPKEKRDAGGRDEAGIGKVERVATLRERRGEGIGAAVMDVLEETARAEGYGTLVLHAQTHAEAFYHRLGYETTSGVFEEADIPHVEMEKRLDDS